MSSTVLTALPPGPPRCGETRAASSAKSANLDTGRRKITMLFKPVTRHVRHRAIAALLVALTAATVRTQETRAPRNAAEFDAMFKEINNWRRWGADDQRGT